jgi:hypothetical protein
LEQIDHIFYGKGTKTNWLYQGVRESTHHRSAAIRVSDIEAISSRDETKEEVEGKHLEAARPAEG